MNEMRPRLYSFFFFERPSHIDIIVTFDFHFNESHRACRGEYQLAKLPC